MNKEQILTSREQKIFLIIFSFFLCAVLLEIGLRIGSFIYLSLQEHSNKIAIKQAHEYRIICLGESTTAMGGKNSYPSQLEEILNESDIGIRFSVINKGIPGITTGGILFRLKDNLDKYKPHMVITMIGINDRESNPMLIAKPTLFFSSLKIYKLTRLIWLGIINKFRKIKTYKSLEIKQNIANLPNYESYYRLIQNHKQLGEYNKAEEMLKKAIEIMPNRHKAYAELGWLYWELEDYEKAEEVFKEAIEIMPETYKTYAELGWFYWELEDYEKAEEMFKEAIDINPKKDGPYIELGWFYKHVEDYEKAKETFKKAININPREDTPYIELGWIYWYQEKYDKSEEMFMKALEIKPENNRLYRILSQLYKDQKKNKLAEEFLEKSDKSSLVYYNSIAEYNYKRIKELVLQRGAKLVCVQYPIYSIRPLKKILNPHNNNVFFVDNEVIFKRALKQENYKEYFTDMFGGDFGHCTRKGNRLLAGNIAKVVLNQCLKEYTDDF